MSIDGRRRWRPAPVPVGIRVSDNPVFGHCVLNCVLTGTGTAQVGVGTGPPANPDEVLWTFYSLACQQLLEVTGHEPSGTDPATATRQEQQFWGARGTDDALLRRIDANANGVSGRSWRSSSSVSRAPRRSAAARPGGSLGLGARRRLQYAPGIRRQAANPPDPAMDAMAPMAARGSTGNRARGSTFCP
jgi:hypothetical protein